MKKHLVVMTAEQYFLLKNYMVEIKDTLQNDIYLKEFYKAFAIDSNIKLERGARLFDNPTCTVEFYLKHNQTILSTVGLFCREQAIDQYKNNPRLSKALSILKNYIASELIDILNLR
jgi:hypothetical protein